MVAALTTERGYGALKRMCFSEGQVRQKTKNHNRFNTALQNASKSSGLREVIKLVSSTNS
jgi:hypothetical protein